MPSLSYPHDTFNEAKALDLSIVERDLQLPIPKRFAITTNAFFRKAARNFGGHSGLRGYTSPEVMRMWKSRRKGGGKKGITRNLET